MLAFLLLTAHATPAYDVTSTQSCPPPVVTGSIPAEGEMDVGVDTPLVVVVDGGQCGEWMTFLLEDPLGVVAEGEFTSQDWLGSGRRLRLDVALTPDTAYTLTVIPEYNGEITEIHFTTGTGVYEPPPLDALTLTSEVVDVLDLGGSRLDVLVDATVEAPAGLMVHLGTDPSVTRLLAVSDGEPIAETFQLVTADGADACVYARAEDATGNSSEWVEVCEVVEAPPKSGGGSEEELEPYDPGGRCQVAPLPSAGLLLLGLFGLMRRR